jgi:hypothetical protein
MQDGGKTGRCVMCMGEMRNANGTNYLGDLSIDMVVILLKWIFKSVL